MDGLVRLGVDGEFHLLDRLDVARAQWTSEGWQMLVAIPFALSSPRSGGRAVGIGVALVIAVGFWMVNAVAVAFGRADLLPPVLAAWTANIVFAGTGTVLLLKART